MARRKGRLSGVGLKSAMRSEVRRMSCDRLRDLAGAKKSVLAVDPLLSAYQGLAAGELKRRRALKDAWGEGVPALPLRYRFGRLLKLEA